ncbi:hypothetical protein J5N97_027059 [Dioscorea zingiberensis]|uniref:ARM repeat superfamily protein n=1 Tax=Dioscorea zingiberensis TaxID=325984 RepID=A0A9D5C399_9LILI|nr:hypothetical protein J5N97_027059 [Dioscorea zingiberensis]
MEERQEHKVLMALEALKKASKDVEINPNSGADDGGGDSPSMKALLELETGSEDLFSGDPKLSALSHLLSHLKALASSLRSQSSSNSSGGGGRRGRGFLRLLLRRRFDGSSEISRVAGSIGSEIQSWLDREYADHLIAALRSQSSDDDEKIELLSALETRVSCGFDQGLQDVLLKADVYGAVEAALADKAVAKPVREHAAAAVLALVRFNKAVFVGPVLMGPAVGSIVSIASAATLRVLRGLITHIRSPLVDVLHSDGKIPKLIALLSSGDLDIRAAAIECCLEIGYFGRKEAIEAMMGEGLVKILMELQRSGEFPSSVARFAIQLEVGEGLRQREKRAMKLEVVRRVKEAAITGGEAGTVLTEVLWGSTP